LLEKSRPVRDNQAAIDLLNRALKISPDNAAVQAELRRRTDAATAEAGQKAAAAARAEAIKSAQSAIERALAQGDLVSASKLLQQAEGEYGAASFGAQRQQVSLKREQAAAADKAAADKVAADKAAADKVAADKAAAEQAAADRVRQVRGVLDRFAQAYNSKDLAGLAMVWPSVPRESYRSTFNTFESLSWVFNTCDIDVAAATATATCSVALKRVDVRGRATSESSRRRFVLRNAGGAWRIDEMQLQ